ncbi:MAG: LysR family transcriptional regulator [Deltaproteobacteria bacterium]|nr:LysR family transcriptional regulator [Deltaproteobacteria bacterium]
METKLSLELLPAMAVFARVVEEQGFSAAARSLGVSRSAVSKQVARLEDALGGRLLHRTTRSLSLTGLGEEIYPRCARLAEEALGVETTASERSATPRGVLRVSGPVNFGNRYLAPLVADLVTRHPELRVELSLDDRLISLVEEGFDVAVRIARMEDSSLVVRKLQEVHQLLCAAPAYLEREGEPARIADLEQHACLTYAYHPTARTWSFPAIDPKTTVRVQGPLHSNSGDALREAAVAGLGIVALPDFIAGEDLKAGRLVALFGGRPVAKTNLQVVYPHRANLSPNVRAFHAAALEALSGAPWRG